MMGREILVIRFNKLLCLLCLLEFRTVPLLKPLQKENMETGFVLKTRDRNDREPAPVE